MKNQLTDLENHLFHQIENLMHPVEGADISKEIEKSRAVSDLARAMLAHKGRGSPVTLGSVGNRLQLSPREYRYDQDRK